jgi:hypothetical protein
LHVTEAEQPVKRLKNPGDETRTEKSPSAGELEHMTTTSSHGMSLAYHNKAMDLSALTINVNEDLLAVSDERRAEMVNLQNNFLQDIDGAFKRYARVSLNRVTLDLHDQAKLMAGVASEPVGQALYFPLKVNEDTLTCTLCTRDTTRLDFRRVIPSIEKIQAHLDEVRRITLVRGINFVQQEQVLQRYANRFMQLAENDYLSSKWFIEKHGTAQPSSTVSIDVHEAKEKPDYIKIATYRMPWSVDFTKNEFVPSIDDVSLEISPLDKIDDEYTTQFALVCPALPMIPKLLDLAVTRIKALWKDVSAAFVPPWKHDLVQSIVNRVMAEVNASDYSIKTTPGTIERDMLDKVLAHLKGSEVYASGLEIKFHDLQSQPVDHNIFNAMLEGYKNVVGASPVIDELANTIKAARAAFLKAAIAPGMESDAGLAEAILSHVKQHVSGLKISIVNAAVDEIKLGILKKSVAKMESKLITDMLSGDKGIVKAIGTTIVSRVSQEFVNAEVKRLCNLDAASAAIIDPATFKAGFKAVTKRFISGFKIGIDEFIQLAAELLDPKDQEIIAPHLQKFIALKRDVLFLKEYILKADILAKFLEKHYEHFYDPKSFAKLLGDFVSGELAQLPVEWGSLLGNWLSAFMNVFQIQHAQKAFTRAEIIRKFYEFTKIVADEQNNFDNTFAVISIYAGTLAESKDKKALLEYLKRFEQSQGMQEKLPGYFESRIAKAIDGIKAADLEVTLKQDEVVAAITRRASSDILALVPATVAIPSEVVLQFDKDAKIEFKLAIEAAPDGLTVTMLTNWFKLVDAY